MGRLFKIVIDKSGYPVIAGAGAQYLSKRGQLDYRPLVMHRWMVQDELGIKSYDGRYHIHHGNGDKLDFRFENLVMLPKDDHALVHSIGKAESRWLTKSEILADTRFNTDYREFDVVWGAVEHRMW